MLLEDFAGWKYFGSILKSILGETYIYQVDGLFTMDQPVYAAKPIEVKFIEVVLPAVDNKTPTLINSSFNKQILGLSFNMMFIY